MMMNTSREVIIVGAGPAGATAATILAQQGHDVLLLDRHTFPRDKPCGDGIPAGSVEIMLQLGMKEKIQQAVASGKFYPITNLHLISPQGHLLTTSFHRTPETTKSYIAPRFYFDALLQQHAVETGAAFCQADVKEPMVENGRVIGVVAHIDNQLQELKARVVIGADGATSHMARTLGVKMKTQGDVHRAVALRAYVEDIETIPHTVEFYLYEGILPGYAWIFPTGQNSANVGVGMRLDKFRQQEKSLEEMFEQFLHLPFHQQRLEQIVVHDEATWPLNFGSPKQLRRAFDGALLVGDAGAFINPLTGGGIENAMLSARLAAQTIHAALQKDDTSWSMLHPYEKQCHELFSGGMRRSYWLNRLLLRFPSIIDFLIRHTSDNNPLLRTFAAKL